MKHISHKQNVDISFKVNYLFLQKKKERALELKVLLS